MRIEYIVVALVIMLVVLLAMLIVGGNIVPAFKSGIEGIFKGVLGK